MSKFILLQKLEFLESGGGSSQPSQEPAYLKDLITLFGDTDTTNDDIFDWIEVSAHTHTRKLPHVHSFKWFALLTYTFFGNSTAKLSSRGAQHSTICPSTNNCCCPGYLFRYCLLMALTREGEGGGGGGGAIASVGGRTSMC